MMTRSWPIVAALCCGLGGCDSSEAPRMAVPTGAAGRSAEAAAPSGAAKAKAAPAAKVRYHGRTAEQWAQALEDPSLDTVRQACRALKVLRGEGRQYLLKGLESSVPETRRMCLEALSVSDLRSFGDPGREILVRLAGDPADVRIRELATRYLKEWHQTIPAP
jgi:hypothetical protein